MGIALDLALSICSRMPASSSRVSHPPETLEHVRNRIQDSVVLRVERLPNGLYQFAEFDFVHVIQMGFANFIHFKRFE